MVWKSLWVIGQGLGSHVPTLLLHYMRHTFFFIPSPKLMTMCPLTGADWVLEFPRSVPRYSLAPDHRMPFKLYHTCKFPLSFRHVYLGVQAKPRAIELTVSSQISASILPLHRGKSEEMLWSNASNGETIMLSSSSVESCGQTIASF